MGYDLHSALHQYSRDAAVDVTAIDAAPLAARIRRRRAVRTATTGLVSTAAMALLAATAYALTTGPTGDSVPAATVTSPTASASMPTREPTPSPPASPAPTPLPESTTPPTDPQPASGWIFGTGGRIASFASHAPEAEVVAYLTTYLGVAPEILDAEYACQPGGVVGRTVEWPGTGVGLRVRTTDYAGNVVDPYVAAWTLMEPSGALGLATEAGLTAGAPRDRVREVYPDAAQGGGQDFGWWYSAADDEGELLILGVDDEPIYRIESGYGCGE